MRPQILSSSHQLKLLQSLISHGHLSHAHSILNSVPNKTALFFNLMIRAYVSQGLHSHAALLFSQMKRDGLKPDCYTFPCVLKSCSVSKDLFLGLQVHCGVAKLGFCGDLFVGNTLVSMYCKCGVWKEGLKVFDEMQNRDLVSWNVMIGGISNSGFGSRAVEMFRQMVKSGKVKPDCGTLASILPAMTKALDRDIEFVRRVFDEMVSKELICWNVMIAIYSNNEMDKEAVELFVRMERESELEPDAVTLASVLPSCGALSAFGLGKRIHEMIKGKKMFPNLVLENSLIDMYANCGSLRDARKVFDEMLERDVVSWTSIICSYGIHGHGKEALKLFDEMLESNLKPDSIAFVSVLSACSHSGLLNEGKYLFNLMVSKYNIIPKHEHYSCMVDLLGRAGCINEAYDFIKKMPIEPNERAWGSLLNSCRVYSNFDVGLIAADNLFELVPKHTGYYVLLSNIYAKANKWHEVSLIRTIMSNKGIKKVGGCSNVELNNKLHTFHVGDNSHPQSKLIYAKLDFLYRKMKEMGFNTDSASALHDIEEEDKAAHLLVHSEKLAIAFFIINTDFYAVVRVYMNLRMCGDCHGAIKLISVITKREIIVKDVNLFHHFVDGVCSCGDYW